jgi:hypothetical protein
MVPFNMTPLLVFVWFKFHFQGFMDFGQTFGSRTPKYRWVLDDTIIEKVFTDENNLISWHWHHSKHRSIRGINLLSALYYTESPVCQISKKDPLRVPIRFETIKKIVRLCDVKTKK